jgi:hypothetical protein
MTKQEAIEILTEMRDWNDYITQSDALQMAIDELEQKPCTDAISRQAVMDGLEKYHEGANLHIDGLTYVYDLVCKLPSVSTENPNRCDLISREWLKTAIHNFYYGLKHTPTEEDIQAYIDVAPSISTEKTGRWIPVSERLPEENEYIGDVCKYYLIQDEYGDMHVAHLSNVGWIPMDSLKAIVGEVIAWMPLPQPYKGESEELDADSN